MGGWGGGVGYGCDWWPLLRYKTTHLFYQVWTTFYKIKCDFHGITYYCVGLIPSYFYCFLMWHFISKRHNFRVFLHFLFNRRRRIATFFSMGPYLTRRTLKEILSFTQRQKNFARGLTNNKRPCCERMLRPPHWPVKVRASFHCCPSTWSVAFSFSC